ncbi:aminotransferase class I/II-fold pyridoxal phosphate-dependent enzyme [Jatrophihabitans telluris]|uniref:Aminotransferase class I/II-fold pyridoxal phosphate-dependent enzyme n=1 Tax=Jatrophihabitans telluris TaxID=2038343 RepID=A0ABY4QYZ9_9ACTN|nr:aminotransferase class I/II-fold pyridoxal phosphate-dependent enzyme [Jatrophihabitans telluris]UQX88347.1 aminotransferase class I/II-fold pyridoxal phosphate-dependent enzyme [Jatrophihabitans telluris]
MHQPNPEELAALDELRDWARHRLTDRDGPWVSHPTTSAGLPQSGTEPAVHSLPAISPAGVGLTQAWHTLRDVLLPSTVPTDHPRYLAFVAGAPSVAAAIADMALSIGSVYAGSELEAGLVVRAEAEAIQWLAALAGLPPGARGAFVSGGSAANLSALVAARAARAERAARAARDSGAPAAPHSTAWPHPGIVLASANSHSSVAAAVEIMGCELRIVGEVDRPMLAADLAHALREVDPADVIAVAAIAGATNTGQIDDLDRIATLCARHGLWLHVDAAYGGAALLDKRVTDDFLGLERADSLVINPHKWLFTPYESSALLYRNPDQARRTHAQRSHYLDAVSDGDNPADYAFQLSRRARGLPLWLSLVANGTDAYRTAVERCVDLALESAALIRADEQLTLLSCELSVVVFERVGWSRLDYAHWSVSALHSGLGLVTPTTYRGRPALRFCFVNPQTAVSDVRALLASLGGALPPGVSQT